MIADGGARASPADGERFTPERREGMARFFDLNPDA